MAKRKSSKKQSQGVIYLIVLACLALICREPIARALQDKLPVIKAVSYTHLTLPTT